MHANRFTNQPCKNIFKSSIYLFDLYISILSIFNAKRFTDLCVRTYKRFHILAHNPNSPTPTPPLTVALIYLLSSKTLALILKTTQEVRQIDRRTIFVIGGGKKLFRSFNSVQCFWYFAFPFAGTPNRHTHTHSYEPTTKTNKPKKQIQKCLLIQCSCSRFGVCETCVCVWMCVRGVFSTILFRVNAPQ